MSESTDPRYADLLVEIEASMGQDFVHELDEVVGARMADSQDAVPLGGIIEARFSALSAELAELREQIAGEVRTRRLVVVGPDGFERVVAEARSDCGSVRVDSPSGVHVALVADEMMEGEASAQVYLSAGGDGVGHFGVTEAGEVDAMEYLTSLDITVESDDPRFHDVSLDRDGLHFGG